MTAAPDDAFESPAVQLDPRFRLAFSTEEVAALLGISPELVKDLLRTGALKSCKAGRRRLISRANIDEFLAAEASLEERVDVTPLPGRRPRSLPTVNP